MKDHEKKHIVDSSRMFLGYLPNCELLRTWQAWGLILRVRQLGRQLGTQVGRQVGKQVWMDNTCTGYHSCFVPKNPKHTIWTEQSSPTSWGSQIFLFGWVLKHHHSNHTMWILSNILKFSQTPINHFGGWFRLCNCWCGWMLLTPLHMGKLVGGWPIHIQTIRGSKQIWYVKQS